MTYPNNSSDWLQRLIGFDTISHNSNLALIDDIHAFLLTLGLSPMIVPNAVGDKANLWVSIYNHSPAKAKQSGGIVLSGHSDVVPVANQAWSQNPFCAWISDGKIYGRGACDMKGFLACVLNFLPEAVGLAKENKLTHPLHLAVSFDEEVGCLGVPLLLAKLKTWGAVPDYCIVGEPTQLQAVVAHKGISVYECTIQGKSTHSSLTPVGVNAISYGAKMIEFITNVAEEAKDGVQDTAFDVPFTTLSVGQIQGGTAVNIVPDSCSFVFEQRHLPNSDPDVIIQKIFAYAEKLSQTMQKIAPECGIYLTKKVAVPALPCHDKQAELLTLIAKAKTQDNASANPPKISTQKVAYATEGGHFYQADIPTVICGPGRINEAHKADEFIAISELERCDRMLARLFTKD